MPHDDSPPFESKDVTRLRVPTIVRLLPLVALAPQLPRILGRLFDLDSSTLAMFSLASSGAMLLGVLAVLKRLNDRSAEMGVLRASSEGIHWNGALIVERARITGGVVLPDAPGGTRVRISRRRGAPMEFGVTNVAEGRDLLRALGLDASQVTATFRVRSSISTSRVLFGGVIAIAMVVAFLSAHLRLPPMTTPLAMIALVLAFAWPQKVVVGTDGVFVNWFVRRKFIPYTELARIDDTKTGLDLVTKSGERHRLEFNGGRNSKAQVIRAQTERDSLRSRIEQARAAAPDAAPAVDPGVVARGERDVGSWLDALRSIAHREGGMRTAPVLREQLFAMVANTRLAASVRAGAAAALGLDAAPTERERLRETAAAIASPRVRVVVEAAAQGDEAKISAALEDVHDEDTRKRAAS
jgi:hypothetical protein